MWIYSPWGSLATGRMNHFGDKQLGISHNHIFPLTRFHHLVRDFSSISFAYLTQFL